VWAAATYISRIHIQFYFRLIHDTQSLSHVAWNGSWIWGNFLNINFYECALVIFACELTESAQKDGCSAVQREENSASFNDP
jgi:hypothetical protein